tara:strand:- start:1796 stop:2254 length:459 start_codon:yes stop_codon:yes gene_type:complete
MSHFSSKRLLQAQRVKLNNVKNKPALVSSTGRGRVNFRLINKRVYKPKKVDTIKYVTINTGAISNLNQINGGNDFWSTNPNPPFSFIHTYDVQIGDEITITKPSANIGPIVVTVQNVLKDAGTGRAFRIITTPNHGISPLTQNCSIKIIDRS